MTASKRDLGPGAGRARLLNIESMKRFSGNVPARPPVSAARSATISATAEAKPEFSCARFFELVRYLGPSVGFYTTYEWMRTRIHC